MLHSNLRVYYETNFALMQYHKWNIEQIDECMPWEKEVYINMLVQHLKEEQRRYEDAQRRR